MVVNYGESCCASGCESCCTMLSQSFGISMCTLCHWVWIMLCYTQPVIGNTNMHAVPVGVNHGELSWTSGCASLFAMLSQWLWIIVSYADPGVWESWYAMLSQLLWIMMCYAEPVVVNHCELCWSSGCEALWVILSEWLWIILCYAEPGGWESWCAMLCQWLCSIVWYWAGCVGIMMCYVDSVGVNYGVLCWDGYVGIMVCFA